MNCNRTKIDRLGSRRNHPIVKIWFVTWNQIKVTNRTFDFFLLKNFLEAQLAKTFLSWLVQGLLGGTMCSHSWNGSILHFNDAEFWVWLDHFLSVGYPKNLRIALFAPKVQMQISVSWWDKNFNWPKMLPSKIVQLFIKSFQSKSNRW